VLAFPFTMMDDYLDMMKEDFNELKVVAFILYDHELLHLAAVC